MIVAGAGIIGLACAWRLAKLGMRVVIFDAREAAREASWAGAGMLAPGGEIERDSELARRALRSLREYPAFVRELEEECGSKIDFLQCGAFELATTAAGFDALCLRADAQRAIGIESEQARFAGFDARFYPGDAVVDPREVTSALARACVQAGCTLREYEPIIEIDPDGSSARTASETIHDEDGVLIAAGAWSSHLCAALPATRPVRGHLIGWDLEPGTLPAILRQGHTYLLQRSSGRLIAGSSTEDVGFDRTIDEGVAADIRSRAANLLPALARTAPAECWNGFRPVIACEGEQACAPLIGKVGERLWAATGHYRNGILLAPETARLIAESII